MSYYEDFSLYRSDNKMSKKILNIGWLGDDGNFRRGEVSEEFIKNLWEYYKCPLFSYRKRKIYFNEGLDGYWKFFVAIYNERMATLGKAEIRILDNSKSIIYVAPDLIIHYIINHKYFPPEEFVNAVINGPKPNSKEYSTMIVELFSVLEKRESISRRCPFCFSKYTEYAYNENKEYKVTDKLQVVEASLIPQEKFDLKKNICYQMCKTCGKLSIFEPKSSSNLVFINDK